MALHWIRFLIVPIEYEMKQTYTQMNAMFNVRRIICMTYVFANFLSYID